MVRVLLDLLVLDIAVETWQSGSPIRDWVVVPAVVYLVLTMWLLVQGARPGGDSWFMQVSTPYLVLLGLLVVATRSSEGMARGLIALWQPTPVVLVAATLSVVLLAGFRLVTSGLPTWIRFTIGAACLYAVAACVLGALQTTPYAEFLHGRSFWERAPSWLRGGFVGAFILIPLGLAGEVGVALARVMLGRRLRWMILFGLGLWMATNTVAPWP